eukprot:gene8497-17524_t
MFLCICLNGYRSQISLKLALFSQSSNRGIYIRLSQVTTTDTIQPWPRHHLTPLSASKLPHLLNIMEINIRHLSAQSQHTYCLFFIPIPNPTALCEFLECTSPVNPKSTPNPTTTQAITTHPPTHSSASTVATLLSLTLSLVSLPQTHSTPRILHLFLLKADKDDHRKFTENGQCLQLPETLTPLWDEFPLTHLLFL